MDRFFYELADAGVVKFWFWTGILGLFVLALFHHAFSQLRRSRLIRDVPTSKIRSAAQGHVELEGLPRDAGQPIQSPLSRVACAWWHYQLDEKQRDSDGDKVWVTLEKGDSVAPFVLEDGSGQCLVEPIGAEILHAEERCWHGRSRDDALRPDRNVFWFRKYRFTERYLWYDKPLYALGEFRTVPGDDGDLEHHLGKADSQPFILSAGTQRALARSLRRSAFRSYAWFIVLGGAFVALVAARLGTGDGPTDVPQDWALLERSPWPNQDRLYEKYVQMTPVTVGPLQRLAFKSLNRRERADTLWDKQYTSYRYYDCAKGTVSSQELSETPARNYEEAVLAGDRKDGGISFDRAREQDGQRVAGAPDLPTLACGGTPIVSTPQAEPAGTWSAFRAGDSGGAGMVFYLQRSAASVSGLKRIAFRKALVSSEAQIDAKGWPTYFHYYDCRTMQVSPAVDETAQQSFEQDLSNPRRAARIKGWLTFEQTEAAAFGFRGDPEVVALACGGNSATTMR